MSRRAGLILFALQLLVLSPSAGVHQMQEVQADWIVGPPPAEGWTVGDLIPLQLKITYPADLPDIDLPELPQNWGDFELREQRVTPVQQDAGVKSVVRTVVVTLWAPGEYETPPLTLSYRDGAGELHEVTVPPAHITVQSVLDPADQEKRDLKPQVWLPGPPVWPWLLGGLGLTLLLGTFGWAAWQRRGRRAGLPATPPASSDPLPADVIAYAELDRVAALDLPSKGHLKLHYTLVADCLRTFLLNRYGIPAMDLTTEELIVTLGHRQIDGHQTGMIGELLGEADLVKFARFAPPVAQARTAVQRARHIVDAARPDEETGMEGPRGASPGQPPPRAASEEA